MDNIHAPTVASGPTSRPMTNGSSRKLTLHELADQKERIEAELSALSSVLDSHGVNMNTSLTTFDGYPRADIDVAQVRTTRARVIRLKNDHKEVMKQLEEVITEHFAADKPALPTNSSRPAGSRGTHSTNGSSINERVIANGHAPAVEPAFAKVNTVAPNSPAAVAGLQTGDQIVRFGAVNWLNHERLGKVAQTVQQHENQPIIVKVIREGSAASDSVDLRLVPKRDWGGRGLLGCHLLPV